MYDYAAEPNSQKQQKKIKKTHFGSLWNNPNIWFLENILFSIYLDKPRK